VIEIRKLSRSFGNLIAVDKLDLDVGNEIFGLLGPNGAGKSTTVMMLTTLLKPSSGTAKVCGYDVVKDSKKVRSKISYVPQDMAVDRKLTGRENVLFYAKLYGIPNRNSKVDEVIEMMGLSDRAGDLVVTYSGGMRRRLELAQALVHEPEVLFLDEPTAALDPVAARHVHALVENLARREGCTVFLCTHNLVEAQKLCDRVAVMEHGRLVALGTPSDLTRQYVKRLDVDLEVDPVQMGLALQTLQELPQLVISHPKQEKDILTMTLAGRESIPELLSVLVQKGLRVYRLAPQEANLEEVYFALNGGAQ